MSTIYESLVKKYGFSPAQKIILEKVLIDSSVLEIGASAGYMTKILKDKGCQVDAVEADVEASKKLKKIANKTFEGSIEDFKIQNQIKKSYQFIICVDVLEHLVDPEKVLIFLKKRLKKNGVILISIPNIAFWGMRKQLFFNGDFSYQESGLLDKTHLRFYSLNNFKNLLINNGLKNLEIYPAETRIPFENSLNKIPVLGKVIVFLLKKVFVKIWPNLSIYHYVTKIQI